MHPADIDARSGCRLPLPDRERLDEPRRQIYDSLADPAGGSLRGLRGPGGIALHSPGLAPRLRAVNQYLRHESGLGGRVREIAILTAARALDSDFIWAAHEAEALRQGVPPAAVDAIRCGRPTAGLAEADAAIVELGREIFLRRAVSPATYRRALAQFGAAALVDLVGLMGNYAGTAALLTAFAMQLDPGQEPLPPPASEG